MTTNVKTLIKNENKVGIVVANNINERVKPDAITDTYSLMNVKILHNGMRLTISNFSNFR